MRKTLKSRLIVVLLIFVVLISLTSCLIEVTPIQSKETTSTTINDTIISDPNPDDTSTHICVFGDWKTVKEATSTDDGFRERECECGNIEQEIIHASGKEYTIEYRNLKSASYPKENGYNSIEGMLHLPTPEAPGYVFVGWYTASIGGELIDYIPKGSTQDYILFAHWDIVSYDIVYKNAANNSNVTSYTIEDKLKLENPQWSGLKFTHWSDDNGNIYIPEDNITIFPSYTYGELVLTANWKRLQNIATPSNEKDELIVVYDDDNERYMFVYEIGTIEHVILEKISLGSTNLKYNSNAGDLSFELSNTVTIEDTIADSIAKEISESVSRSNEWSQTKDWAKTHSETEAWESKVSIGVEIGKDDWWGKIKASVEHSDSGSETDESSWGESTQVGGSESNQLESSSAVSSTISYKKEISNTVTTNITISKDMPAGYYSYVHAGNIRVYAVVTYDPSTKSYYLDTYSVLDNMHEMILYYRDVNELNSLSYETLAFDVNTVKIDNYFSTSIYNVQYDANGGEGAMPISVLSNDMVQPLYPNQFKKTGYTFAGWRLRTENEDIVFQDKQKVTNLAGNGDTITLSAIWTPNTYEVIYEANTGYGSTRISTHTYDSSEKLTSNGFGKNGYSFVCWNTRADGRGMSYDDNAYVENLATEAGSTVILFAIWKINTYTVFFDTDGGTTISAQQYDYHTLTLAPTSPTRVGFDFVEWSFDGSDGFTFGNPMPDRDIVAKAIWKYKTVTYDSGEENKKIDASYEYNYDTFSIEELSVFMTEGYKLEFSIQLYMKEENEGYQEIYLRNSNGVNIAGNSEFAHGGSGTDEWGWEYFTFTVDGENCTDTIHVIYGAHGKYSDDWLRRRFIVTVKVIPE